jgi:hypothetical protein
VDPSEIPAEGDIGKLGQALAAGVHGERDELMANTAAYSGPRWGELAALTFTQVNPDARVIIVDRERGDGPGHRPEVTCYYFFLSDHLLKKSDFVSH